MKELITISKAQSPILPITFVRGSERLSYFSLITTVGTPQCITGQELRIECRKAELGNSGYGSRALP